MTDPETPAGLAAVQAFTNTLDLEDGTDALAEAEGLRRFLVEQGLASGALTVSAAELAAAVELRESLRTILHDHAHEEPGVEAAVERLNRAMEEARLAPRLDAPDSWELVPRAPGVAGALGVLLARAADAMRDGTWARLKICGNDACRWAFYDHSRNRSGRWCSMAVCGNRMKVRAYRERSAD